MLLIGCNVTNKNLVLYGKKIHTFKENNPRNLAISWKKLKLQISVGKECSSQNIYSELAIIINFCLVIKGVLPNSASCSKQT